MTRASAVPKCYLQQISSELCVRQMNKDLLKLIESLSANDSKTLSQKALKMTEEVGELAKAVLPFESASGTTHRFVDRNKILEEVADSLLVDLSIMYDVSFTYEELEDMVQKKAMKWAGLQNKERAANFPVPFGIHITVKDAPVEDFKHACKLIGVKPLLLDLQNNSGENVLFDLMTSQVHIGNNTSAYAAMRETSKALTDFGFKVIREKISCEYLLVIFKNVI
jgi:NTP pyrophosphatase (non-canonical NTP hydrolase)